MLIPSVVVPRLVEIKGHVDAGQLVARQWVRNLPFLQCGLVQLPSSKLGTRRPYQDGCNVGRITKLAMNRIDTAMVDFNTQVNEE